MDIAYGYEPWNGVSITSVPSKRSGSQVIKAGSCNLLIRRFKSYSDLHALLVYSVKYVFGKDEREDHNL